MSRFASNNRAAMNVRAPGETRIYLDVDGNPTNVPPAYGQPSVSQSYAPVTPTTGTPPYIQPTSSAPMQPEVPWIAGVPNWLTMVTAVAVGYATYKAIGEPKAQK